MAKIKIFKKDVDFSTIREVHRGGKYNAGVISGTDCILLFNRSDIFIYSYKARFDGSRTDDYLLDRYLQNEGWAYHYALFGESEWARVSSAIKRVKFKPTDKESAVKCLKAYRGFRKPKNHAEYGVELEVESLKDLPRAEIAAEGGALIQDVGSDGSVRGGTEIRFNHPALSGWKYKDVSKVLTFCKEKGATNEFGTAGMHIHISRPDIRKVVDRFAKNLSTMQEILYPINCRKKLKYDKTEVSYGVGGNIYHDQISSFGTLEIRAWNSTLDPKLFMARIKFCKTITDWLAKTKVVSVESFFDSLSPKDKRNYAYMMNHPENPHEWGFPPKAINALLAA